MKKPCAKKPWAMAAVFSLLALPAFGADLASRAAPAYAPPPPPTFSWTGFYLGANAGLSGGNFNSSDYYGTFGSGDQNAANSIGFSGGGQLGYNYQFQGSNLVVGIETDFQARPCRAPMTTTRLVAEPAGKTLRRWTGGAPCVAGSAMRSGLFCLMRRAVSLMAT